MTLTDQRDVQEQATGRVVAAEEAVATLQGRLIDGFRRGSRANVAAMLRRLSRAARELQAAVVAAGEYLAAEGLPVLYRAGAVDAAATIRSTIGFSWDQPHLAAVERLAGDTHSELLAASRRVGLTSDAFARRVREGADRLAGDVREGRTAVQIGRDLARDLQANRISAVTYADASRRTAGDYASMLARTKSALAYNFGATGQMRRDSVTHVEFLDGAGCGLTSHDDPDKVNGTVRPIEDAEAYPISHPQCRRAFAARLDVRSDDEAAAAAPSVSAASRADQAASERAQAAATDRRRTARTTRVARVRRAA